MRVNTVPRRLSWGSRSWAGKPSCGFHLPREKAPGEGVPAPVALGSLSLGAKPPRARGWRERLEPGRAARRLRADGASAGHALSGSPGTRNAASGRARSWLARVAQPRRPPRLVGPQTAPPPGGSTGRAPRKHRRGRIGAAKDAGVPESPPAARRPNPSGPVAVSPWDPHRLPQGLPRRRAPLLPDPLLEPPRLSSSTSPTARPAPRLLHLGFPGSKRGDCSSPREHPREERALARDLHLELP